MTRAAKAKGRTGQNEIRDKILQSFPDLEPDDVKSTTMGDTGEISSCPLQLEKRFLLLLKSNVESLE